jgi:dTDP-4-amino-4,6-dideoxygalactose transaminase
LYEKGADRARFFRGEVDNCRWVGLGSSFLPSDLLAAYLYAQLENTDLIQQRRRELWSWYDAHIDCYLPDFGFHKPQIPAYARHNGHLYYLVCDTPAERTRLIHYLKDRGIQAVFTTRAAQQPVLPPVHRAGTATNPTALRPVRSLPGTATLYHELEVDLLHRLLE